MTFYILFALALGAISAVTEAPVARPAVANVERACGIRQERRGAGGSSRTVRRQGARRAIAFSPSSRHRADAPLAGAATPRAPGRLC